MHVAFVVEYPVGRLEPLGPGTTAPEQGAPAPVDHP